MNIYPLYYSTYSFNQFLFSSTSSSDWIQHTMSTTNQSTHNNKKRKCIIDTNNDESVIKKQKKLTTINHFQNDLDHLFYEWNTIHIVLESIRNAFTITQGNMSEEHLDQIDRELSIAYDDLMSQVRHLERQLKKMSNEIHQKLILDQQEEQQWDRRPLTPTPNNKGFLFGVTSTHNK